MLLSVRWGPNKNATNIEKHGIAFEGASTVFDDVFVRVISDPDHSDNEDRFIILGVSVKANVLIVCHRLRQSGHQSESYPHEKQQRRKNRRIGGIDMRAEYDFENSQINPYKKAPREKITIQLNVDVIDYFKAESVRTGIPYQNIINFYLTDCAREGKHLTFS